MKHPKPRNAAIDNSRYSSWRETFAGYRQSVTDGSIDRWLEQFHANDKDVAARILDSVDFISGAQINDSFRQFLAGLPGWNIDENQRKGKWRFVPFTSSSGESGDSMTHKFRHANSLGSKNYKELFIYRRDLPSQMLTQEDTVVFIDDFSGTGKQVCDYWKELPELLPEQPTTYLVLVGINNKARKKIEEETDLQVVSQFDFDDTDNLFSDHCTHFSSDEKDKILSYCRKADRRYPKGSGECGMVLVFAHNTPNNSIPILHTNHGAWEGLFKRYD